MKRFWSKVEKTETCWLWKAGKNPDGYGVFRVNKGKVRGAHCFAYELTHGAIPAGLQLDHFFCNNPSCVRPDHLRPVTPRENQLRSNSASALAAAKTHCPKGHPYDERNTYWRTDGKRGRVCKACKRQYDLRRNAPLQHQSEGGQA